MSGSTVTVLALNGRKQKVKCTPNTTILQILEEVCKKQDLNATEYDIKHHNNILDITTTFRFSGLPNNAQLELVPALKNRNESTIILAINFEDDRRIMETFSPHDTFLYVLKKCCLQSAIPEYPVVIYMRREIFGNELNSCTLRSVGITGGRAMIRVLNRDPELLHQQANISGTLPVKPTEEKPFIRKFQPLYVEHKPPPQQMETEDTDKETTNINDMQITRIPTEKRKSPARDHYDDDQEKRKISNVIKTDINVEQMDIDSETMEEEHIASVNEEEFIFCGPRNGMIFSLESAQSVHTDDLPDDFFELTIDDAKMIFRDLKKKRYDLENQMMKTTRLRDLEEQGKQDKKLKKYKRAIIRVQFSDRTIIQGTFKPQETVQDIVDFIRTYLKDGNLNFYIYSTPPKCILDTNSKLIDIGCVPGALLHFGTDQLPLINNNYLKDEYLSRITTNNAASLAAARIRNQNTLKTNDNHKNEHIPDMVLAPSTITSDQLNYGASTSANTASSIRSSTTTINKPKWFKPL